MVCIECRKLLHPRYKINKTGNEQLFEQKFDRSISGLKATAACCGICQALVRKLPSDDQASLQVWRKKASIFADDNAHYTASLNEASGTKGTYRLSLRLDRVRDRRYSKPMLSEMDQGVVSDFLLVPVAKSADVCVDESYREIAITTSSEPALDIAKGWLNQCLLHHPLCGAGSSPRQNSQEARFLPTRVIRILPEGIRLYTTTEAESDGFQYATLSHRWPLNADSILQLTTDNIHQWHSHIEQDNKFSTAFKDAITVCKYLGIEYLWIDSLCILQRGDGGEDWQREAARMGAVYKYGLVNIAATSVVNGEEGLEQGFFRIRDPAIVSPDIITASCNYDYQTRRDGLMGDLVNVVQKGDAEPTDYHVVPMSQFVDNVLDAPLNQRAWVMQERHLSPRILHFTSQQIFWECNKSICSETYQKAEPIEFFQRPSRSKALLGRVMADQLSLPESPTVRLQGLPTKFYELWYSLVGRYSCGGLTKTTDKLIAVSGIAREIAQCMGASQEDYTAGLWRQDLLYGLLWKTPTIIGPGTCRVRPGKDEPYQAPSWSWASVNCPVTVNYRLHRTPHDTLAVVNTVHVKPKLEPLGEIRPGAFVKITGTTYKARLCYADWGGRIWPELSVGVLNKIQPRFKGSFAVLPDERFLDGDSRQRDDIRVLPILQSKQKSTIHRQKSHSSAWLVMLMLVPTVRPDEYERFGIVELRGNGSDTFLNLGMAGKMLSDPREETVTII